MITDPEFVIGQVHKFVENHDHAIILQYGVKMLRTLYDQNQLYRYLDSFKKIAKKGQCQVVFIFSMSEQENLAEALGGISIFPAIAELLTVLNHEVRCTLIQLLGKEPLRYRNLLHNIDVKHSSDLSHHLKILKEHGIIEKQDTLYQITTKGQHYSTIMQLLAASNLLYQKASSIAYFPLR